MAVLKVQVQPAQRGDLSLPQSLAQIGLTHKPPHNALKHRPAGGRLTTTLASNDRQAALTQAHSAPGIADSLRPGRVQPFSGGTAGGHGRDTGHDQIDASNAHLGGSDGLGRAIRREIVVTLGGSLTLHSRLQHGRIARPDATVRLPLADNPSP